jgi:hypothetical protein
MTRSRFDYLDKCRFDLIPDENVWNSNSKVGRSIQTLKTKVNRRVWRHQRGNQNPYLEEEQTTQWLKEKVQKDKQRSTKHTQ